MTRENAKDFLPLVHALAEGKTIQILYDDIGWEDCNSDIAFCYPIENYRVKPETEYAPFKSIEELINCWKEKCNTEFNHAFQMPLIWVKHKVDNEASLIIAFDISQRELVFIQDTWLNLKDLFNNYTFLDLSPIGKIKEE